MFSCLAFFSCLFYALLRTATAVEENIYCSSQYDCHYANDNMTYVNTLCTVRTWIFRDAPDLQKDDRSGAALMKANDVTEILPLAKKKFLLQSHNALRNATAAGKTGGMASAADMMRITWDLDLERLALAWALEAVGGHDMCRSQPPKYPQVGQNIALFGPTADKILDSSAEDAFALWHKEIADLGKMGKTSASNNTNKAAPKMENVSQILSAATSKMGCSEVAFNRVQKRSENNTNNWYRFLVCNYGPGKEDSKPMYTKGRPCSKCPKNSQCGRDARYPNLCSGDEEDFVAQTSAVGSIRENRLIRLIFALVPPFYSFLCD